MTTPDAHTSDPAHPAARFVPMLIGLTSLAVLVQSVLAGVFLRHDGRRDTYTGSINAHMVVGNIAVVLALATAVLTYVALRSRRDLVIGTVVLFVLLVGEFVLGDLITGKIGSARPDLTVVHVPLGSALLAVTVWLAIVSGRRTVRA